MRPNAFIVRATARSANDDLRTSPGISTQRRPSRSTASAVMRASFASTGRKQIAMSAPSRAKSTATARPMPESPPVMSATLSRSFPDPR